MKVRSRPAIDSRVLTLGTRSQRMPDTPSIDRQPLADLCMDFLTAEQIEMAHAVSDPSMRFRQFEIARRELVPTQCAVHRYQAIAADRFSRFACPFLSACGDRVTANAA